MRGSLRHSATKQCTDPGRAAATVEVQRRVEKKVVRTKREVQGGNKRKVERERRERDGGIEEGMQEGKAIKAKGKVRGRGGEERQERTGVHRARSAGRGARDWRAVPGVRARSGRRPLLAGLGVGPRGPGARRGGGTGGGDGAAAAGEGCARAGCARQGRQAPRSGAFVLCRGKQAAPAWRWPSAGASSGAPRARWIGHPRNRPTFPPPL